MFASRRMLVLAGLAVVIGVLAGVANAEPKNQWPFTRIADPRALAQSAGRSVDCAQAGGEERAAVHPLRRHRCTTKGDRQGASALTLSGGGAGGIDGPLMAWIAVAATILTGGALVFGRSSSIRARQWGNT